MKKEWNAGLKYTAYVLAGLVVTLILIGYASK